MQVPDTDSKIQGREGSTYIFNNLLQAISVHGLTFRTTGLEK